MTVKSVKVVVNYKPKKSEKQVKNRGIWAISADFPAAPDNPHDLKLFDFNGG